MRCKTTFGPLKVPYYLSHQANNGVQPKLNAVVCFYQSCPTDADFVISFKLLSYRHLPNRRLFFYPQDERNLEMRIICVIMCLLVCLAGHFAVRKYLPAQTKPEIKFESEEVILCLH